MSTALHAQNRNSEAEPLLRRALAIREKALGEANPYTIISFNNLAGNLEDQAASPDAPEAQGLSGLSRAFFFAGAKSLLVSHWRVRDDVAPKLIPAMLLAQRQHPDLSRAEALRQASLAILDDHTIYAADPSAWAPFTLIGEAGR